MPSPRKIRAVIYPRYSSDQQREASIEDQVEVCRRYAQVQGWEVVRVYPDHALSGASRFRPAFQQMLADAEARKFEVIIAEALDRLSRKLADVAEFHDRLTFLGIRLHTVATGEVTPMHVGVLGMMAQIQLKDLAEKTKRGQLGRALKGKVPGGKAYGYDVLPATAEGAGERRVNPAQAVVVRRIFELFAAGLAPREIARRLNAEGVPGPDGRPWGDTTIRGQAERGNGILNNATYVGRLEWNRCSYVKDPRTGKKVARPNPPDQWEIVPVPELRIVPDELWEAVKARQAEVGFVMRRDEAGHALNRSHRHRYLLSGLLECGLCGGSYAMVTARDYGCATRRSKGTCGNGIKIRREEIESRVLHGLKERLLAPERIEQFTRMFQEEMNRLAAEQVQCQAQDQGRLQAVERKIASLIRAVEDGLYQPSMKGRLEELEAEKAALEARLTRQPTAIRFHPGLARQYRIQVENLEKLLAQPASHPNTVAAIRGQIEKVTLTPRADGTLEVLLHGELARILQLCEVPKDQRPGTDVPGREVSVVAGAGFGLCALFVAPGLEAIAYRT
jgi:site-specific DNA recombinase